MSESVEALVLDLLEWLARQPRTRAEVMATWRTSCPRLPVWEDACDRGFIHRERSVGRGELVSLSPAGRAFLEQHRGPRLA